MKEKISISRPTGSVEEKKVICHFKTMDDTYPHIKGVPVLIVDKNENNNGNTVLEFFWEKDGLYQAIMDDAAWSEVKSVIISIIKNNFTISDGSMGGLVYLDTDRVNANVGSGKNLGLSPVQSDSLSSNFRNKVSEHQKTLNTVSMVEQTPIVNEVVTPEVQSNIPVVPEPVMESMPNNNIIENQNSIPPETPSVTPNPVNDIINTPVDNNIIEPFAPNAPSIDNVLNMGADIVSEPTNNVAPVVEPTPINIVTPEPVIPTAEPVVADIPVVDTPSIPVVDNVTPSVTPQIVSTPEETDIDLMRKEIIEATDAYKEKVMQIITSYETKINDAISKANEYKEKAEEHLKNAQAAEQIAEIARQNSQKIQNDFEKIG